MIPDGEPLPLECRAEASQRLIACLETVLDSTTYHIFATLHRIALKYTHLRDYNPTVNTARRCSTKHMLLIHNASTADPGLS